MTDEDRRGVWRTYIGLFGDVSRIYTLELYRFHSMARRCGERKTLSSDGGNGEK